MTATPEQLAHYAAVGVEAAEFSEMKRDAERYRWLRRRAFLTDHSEPNSFSVSFFNDEGPPGEFFDDCLDIVMNLPAVPNSKPADGWLEWNGGRIPVGEDIIVVVRLRSGRELKECAEFFKWRHTFDDGDVIAYRTAG